MSAPLALLLEGRRNELEQALFYRCLAGAAARAGDEATAERLNGLLADEQHHVSRLTARILELGGRPEDAAAVPESIPALDAWEAAARGREQREVEWYETALARIVDAGTRAILAEIMDSERRHRDTLSGKWMPAEPTQPGEAT